MSDLKAVLMGSSGVGKTQFVLSLHQARSCKEWGLCIQPPTVGIDFLEYKNPRGGAQSIRLWDTAGQERFFAMSTNMCRGADFIVVVFSVNCMGSFEDVERIWHPRIVDFKPTCTFLVATKSDLPSEEHVVDEEMLRCQAQRLGMYPHMCSAKDPSSCHSLMDKMFALSPCPAKKESVQNVDLVTKKKRWNCAL